ncbi:MAG TPA: nucleotidyltransferase domain-containing protein [Desulfatiglandales bacterium]|nr:nucleotidyltransferase domain-containing protein [Desulfatiglandales bacterium]
MEKEDVIKILRRFKKLKGGNYGIVRIGLFGSVVRGALNDQSDIDVVVLGKPDMFNLIGIKQDLEEEFQRSVDLVRHREKMNPFLKKRIEKEAIYV